MKRFTTPGAITAIISALISLAAGIFYNIHHGTFGTGKPENCWSPVTFGLLIACIIVVVLLLLLKLPGLASFVATTIPGVCVALFFIGINGARGAYWHLSRLPYEEKNYGVDPDFVIFLALLLVAFIVGEVAIYLRKKPAAKARSCLVRSVTPLWRSVFFRMQCLRAPFASKNRRHPGFLRIHGTLPPSSGLLQISAPPPRTFKV